MTASNVPIASLSLLGAALAAAFAEAAPKPGRGADEGPRPRRRRRRGEWDGAGRTRAPRVARRGGGRRATAGTHPAGARVGVR